MKTFDQRLSAALSEAFARLLDRPAEQIDAMIRPTADPKFGDYQSNAAMALAKQAKANPRQLAQQAIDAAGLDAWCEPPQVAGPGFINLTLKREAVQSAVAQMLADERLGVESADQPRTVVVDFSAPNVAKPMHVGHIRSTILGDAISRMMRFLGHHVIDDNHVGDWGTQFGKLIVGYKKFLDPQALSAAPIDEMERLYQKVNALCEADPAAEDEARTELARLQAGDEENLEIWRQFTTLSRDYFETIYKRLGVRFDHWLGESFYNPMLAEVVGELESAGLAEPSEGAVAIFFPEDPQLSQMAPMIIRKRDGAFLYATTDLATVKYRVQQWHADEIVYVTDSRQQLHFRQLFLAAEKWKPSADWWPDVDGGKKAVQFKHVWFGTILGPDGKPFKTRTGGTVKLADLLNEAEQRSMAIVEQKNPDLPPEQKARVASAVGVGAIKYFDLSNNRISDYRFDWDQMLALTGNTAPYLQYAYARVRSIFRKAGAADAQIVSAEQTPSLDHPNELALAKHLARYGEAIARAVEDYRPNLLCDYLYELANRFSGFYENCPVVQADEPTRTQRLQLCLLTSRVLSHGLALLGIEVLDQM